MDGEGRVRVVINREKLIVSSHFSPLSIPLGEKKRSSPNLSHSSILSTSLDSKPKTKDELTIGWLSRFRKGPKKGWKRWGRRKIVKKTKIEKRRREEREKENGARMVEKKKKQGEGKRKRESGKRQSWSFSFFEEIPTQGWWRINEGLLSQKKKWWKK